VKGWPLPARAPARSEGADIPRPVFKEAAE
jgi:hypothetical protein